MLEVTRPTDAGQSRTSKLFLFTKKYTLTDIQNRIEQNFEILPVEELGVIVGGGTAGGNWSLAL